MYNIGQEYPARIIALLDVVVVLLVLIVLVVLAVLIILLVLVILVRHSLFLLCVAHSIDISAFPPQKYYIPRTQEYSFFLTYKTAPEMIGRGIYI